MQKEGSKCKDRDQRDFDKLTEILDKFERNSICMVSRKKNKENSPSPEFDILYGPTCISDTKIEIEPFFEKTLPDSGASKSVVPLSMVQKRGIPMLEAKNDLLFAANQSEMKVLGKIKIEASFGNKSTMIDALVSDQIATPILSWLISAKLNLFKEIEKNAAEVKILNSSLSQKSDSLHISSLKNFIL